MDPEEATQDIAAQEPQEPAAEEESEYDEAAQPPEERIQALELQAEQARVEAAAHVEEAAALRAQLSDALERYRGLLLARDPDVPEELVVGDSIAELESSYERASGLVGRLRGRAAEQAAQERVPAGAPARRGPDVSSLSPQQKIILGLQRPN